MYRFTQCYLILFMLLLSACSEQRPKKEIVSSSPALTQPMTIIVQPFDDFPEMLVDSLISRIKEINSDVVVRKSISLPESSYYPPRNRYRADSLINYLWQQSTTKSVVLGLTTKDISSRKGKIGDWGIMGLAYCPGHSCIVSTYRLPKNDINNNLFKVAIHELAHTQGLHHCEESKICFMRDYQGGNLLDELTGFCRFCKSYLSRKGWEVE